MRNAVFGYIQAMERNFAERCNHCIGGGNIQVRVQLPEIRVVSLLQKTIVVQVSADVFIFPEGHVPTQIDRVQIDSHVNSDGIDLQLSLIHI